MSPSRAASGLYHWQNAQPSHRGREPASGPGGVSARAAAGAGISDLLDQYPYWPLTGWPTRGRFDGGRGTPGGQALSMLLDVFVVETFLSDNSVILPIRHRKTPKA